MKAGSDYIGVGVGALIFDDQGRVFLAQRGPKAKNERGCWEFPYLGGAPRIVEPEKCTAIGWFRLNALPTPLSLAT